MLKAYKTIRRADSVDELADELITERLRCVPGVQELVKLREKIDKDFERAAAEIVRSHTPP